MRLNNKRGITLIELIIVLAVIAVIGAILIPTFLDTTERARLKSDIQSARVIQNALELYNAEQPTRMATSSMDEIIEELSDAGYIDEAQAVIQTEDAEWVLDSGIVMVDISGCTDPNIRTKIYGQLTEQEQLYVKGGTQ